ncbi:MAG TPA: hypothetical protein VKA01_13840 [Vicinamibacteria bacterium]|nr:hypothetical protein [Vicinamibacteria bacterium]
MRSCLVPDEGRPVTVTGDVRVGPDAGCGIALADARVSRVHASLVRGAWRNAYRGECDRDLPPDWCEAVPHGIISRATERG